MTEAKRAYRHSTTIYLPRKDNDFLVEALEILSQKAHGPKESVGHKSKFIMNLVYGEMIKEGLMTEKKEPVPEKLEEIKKTIQ